MFLFNCATLGYVSLYFSFSKRSEILYETTQTDRRHSRHRCPNWIRARRHDFCVYRHPVCAQGADDLPLLCDYRPGIYLRHDAGCKGSVAPR